MGRITAFWLKTLSRWEKSTRVAFAIAIILLPIAFILLLYGPPAARQPALIGLGGLLIAAQVIFMWGNRHMVTPYTQAQRYYLNEDFQSARAVLENLQAADKADSNALTLLANTYRQLGLLDKSEEVVKKAIALRPFDPFPHYGFGRTLLVMGRYAEAQAAFRQALEAGAPAVTHLDLGEALCRQGLFDQARAELASGDAAQEPFRELMRQYLLYSMGADEKPARPLIQAGIAYWQDHAERFGHTPYGQALANDIQKMQTLMEET
jgi:Tfp pilus assembly protein PilF